MRSQSSRCRTAKTVAVPGIGVISTYMRQSDVAGVRRCRLLHRSVSSSSGMSCHLTPARKLFGSWAASTAVATTINTQSPAAPTFEDCSDTGTSASLAASEASPLESEGQHNFASRRAFSGGGFSGMWPIEVPGRARGDVGVTNVV
ncbi:LOW QUALITY PROTEIN: hypothetical protein Q4I31_006514 [Leishmania lindenbergi]|uniref:Uncharacterized protein n=1 Tax=Leishmania lindenbergi TaxID=651832 RepID=A0AAW2ZYV1_9TRYP